MLMKSVKIEKICKTFCSLKLFIYTQGLKILNKVYNKLLLKKIIK